MQVIALMAVGQKWIPKKRNQKVSQGSPARNFWEASYQERVIEGSEELAEGEVS